MEGVLSAPQYGVMKLALHLIQIYLTQNLLSGFAVFPQSAV
jgi:hypothetical protein